MPQLLTLSLTEGCEETALNEIRLTFRATLSDFTYFTTSFRNMMRSTGCIITGSTALHFLLRRPSNWKPGHVVIVAPVGQYEAVLNHIMLERGARLIKSVCMSEKGANSQLNTGTTRVVHVHTHLAKFIIKESATASPFHPLPFLWATHLMNAITADATICAYPTLTFFNKTLVTNSEYGPLEHEMRKYSRLGFTVFDNARELADVSNSCAEHVVCGKRERIVGDRYTLVVPTGGKNLHDTVLQLAEGRTTCWKLGGKHCRNRNCFMPGRREVATTYWQYNSFLNV